MIGKARDVNITDPLQNASSLREWIKNNQDSVIIDMKVTAFEDNDYFHVIYKEE